MANKLYISKLDAIRGFAAFYVFLTHFVLILKFIPYPIKILFNFGQEAVIVFFLLSGFVIYLSVYQKPYLTFKYYFIRRFSRIYFPLLFSFAISIIIFYFNGDLDKSFSWTELAGNLLMLQDFSEVKPGSWLKPFLDNLPLWSLGYECWFYLIFFPVYSFLPKLPYKIYFILAFCIISYLTYLTIPNHASLVISYFIIWWSGAEAAAVFTHQGRFTYKNMQPVIFSLLLMSVITVIPVLSAEQIRFGYYPFLMFRHFFDAIVLILVGIFWYKNGLVSFDRIFGVFSKIAPISYSLYILQYPLLTKWYIGNATSALWGICAIKVTSILVLSYLIEIKLQPVVNQWFNKQ